MNFSSIPAYLDPANWQQQSNHPLGVSSGTSSQLLPPQSPSLPPQPQQSQAHGAVGTGSIRPGSMADRARMANIPVPETALKCPRCESTNTKFCYFNNYSLSQPRHFCKTCRRYWTRGGALRSVPVGGGCRRNKRSKASSSKSPASSDRQTGSTASSTNSISSNTGTTAELLGLTSHHIPPLRFMAPMSHLTDFPAGEMGLSYGLSYNPVSAPIAGMNDFTFQIGNALGGSGVSVGGVTGSLVSASGLDHQWKLHQTQQFPLLAGLETSTGLYPFEGHGVDASLYGGGISHIRPKPTSTSGLVSQMASVKMEESQEMNLSRQLLGINNNQFQATDHQYWTNINGTNATWTDLSANFSSSSTTSNHL